MKTYFNTIAIAALTLVAITSCSKDNTEAVNSNDPLEVNITDGTILTRTSGNSWEAGNQIGVTMVKNNTYDIYNDQYNYPYSADETKASTNFTAYDTKLYFPVDVDTYVDFYTYYPYQSTMTDGIYKVDVSSGEMADIDLLRSLTTNKNKNSGDISLELEHRLSQLTMNITRGNNVPTSATITAKVEGMNTTADYDIYTDAISNVTTIADCPVTVVGNTATVILVPQTAGADANVIFTIAGENYTWNITDVVFTKGENLNYNITIKQEGVDVTGVTIGEWGNSTNTSTGTAK